jgi:hypothetical protein
MPFLPSSAYTLSLRVVPSPSVGDPKIVLLLAMKVSQGGITFEESKLARE